MVAEKFLIGFTLIAASEPNLYPVISYHFSYW